MLRADGSREPRPAVHSLRVRNHDPGISRLDKSGRLRRGDQDLPVNHEGEAQKSRSASKSPRVTEMITMTVTVGHGTEKRPFEDGGVEVCTAGARQSLPRNHEACRDNLSLGKLAPLCKISTHGDRATRQATREPTIGRRRSARGSRVRPVAAGLIGALFKSYRSRPASVRIRNVDGWGVSGASPKSKDEKQPSLSARSTHRHQPFHRRG